MSTFTKRFAPLLQELETLLQDAKGNPVDVTLPSGATLTLLPKEAYGRLLGDALAWKALEGDGPRMEVEDAIALFDDPKGI